ncbi:CPBP family glutamic-type intramembrane protease, partial [Lactobacillus crispatus]
MRYSEYDSPNSPEGNGIRYLCYLLGYMVVLAVYKFVTKDLPPSILDMTFFFVASIGILYFITSRYNAEEKRYFSSYYEAPFLSHFWVTVGLFFLVTALRISIDYLQALKQMPMFTYQYNYQVNNSQQLFWFLVMSKGIILPLLQLYILVGFFFNYFFRYNDKKTAFIGILVSGLAFCLCNFCPSPIILALEVLIGMIIAWSYLYSQALWMPLIIS